MAKRRKAGGIEVEGFDELVARLSEINANVPNLMENALTKTHRIVTQKASEAIKPHHRTGNTEKTLVKKANVMLAGSEASVKAGFDISNGGLPSIFLMYGTPTTKKDQNLYNAFYGKKTKDEIREVQEKIFYGELRKLGG